MARHPLDHNSWAWEPLETVRGAVGSEMWIVDLAVAAQPDGWYVRLIRSVESNPPRGGTLLDGPYPDQASAAVSALGLISDAITAIGTEITKGHRNGGGPPD
jgi:hypothetical protein